MKSRFLAAWVAAMNLLVWPAVAAAQDKVPDVLDGRLENYGRPVTLDSHSTALAWLLLLILTLICVAALFKNARRTHLD